MMREGEVQIGNSGSQLKASPRAQEPSYPAGRWHLRTLVGFRFIFIYFLLYMFPWPFYEADPLSVLWRRVVPWLGVHFLHINISPIGGETVYGYTCALLLLIVTAMGTLTWSLLDRHRRSYEVPYRWLRLYVLVYVGAAMFEYGSGKLFPSQFRPPSLSRLLVPLGDMSPQALLWSFMGSSKLYTVFAGAVELLGGLLLFVPRLATVGGLLSAVALSNVLVLNLGYDVHVRLFSIHLLIMLAFLLGPDLRRLADLLVFNRRVEPIRPQPLFRRKWLNFGIVALQLLYGSYLMLTDCAASYREVQRFAATPRNVPFYGIWNVDEFSVDGEGRPPLITDRIRWHRVIFDRPDSWDDDPDPGMAIQMMDGSRRLFFTKFDSVHQTVKLRKLDDDRTSNSALFHILPPLPFSVQLTMHYLQPEGLVLSGDFDGHQVRATLHRTQIDFVLRSRGFHWTGGTAPFWAR